MSREPPSSSWRGAFNALARQGDNLNAQISPSERYYAFLSKADRNDTDGSFDVLFEVVTQEWLDNALFSRPVSVKAVLPTPPALLYHVVGIPEATILSTLGLRTADHLAEGSWYLIRLSKSSVETPDVAVVGDLYDPDIDMATS